MKMKPVETKYGIIHGRDSLILSSTELKFYPFKFIVKASLSPTSCKAKATDIQDIEIEFLFTAIEKLSIYKLDESPFEKHSQSSFDSIEGVYKDGVEHVVLSTYDHVFEVIGKYHINC